MKKHYFLYFFVLTSLFANTQVEDIQFSNSTYTYGTKPNNILQNDIYNAYTSWRNNFVAACNNNRYRIKFDTETQTVSEGVAYGMLLSAFANDKELFDGLWLYYSDFTNANGVMNWKIEECTSVIGENGATDAELDAAYALIVAHNKWGSSGEINYENDALELIEIIKNHEVEGNTYVLKPGDAWGGSSNTNPSYFAPSYFRAFGIFSNDTVFWNEVANKSYSILNANLTVNSAYYNLVSDWCQADGSYSNEVDWATNAGQTYNYDAARTPWRIALDYLWFGTEEALSYTSLCNSFVNEKGGFLNIYPGYTQSGVALNTSYKDPTFTGAYAAAAMSSSNQSFINSGYAELKNQITTAYFGATLRVIYMFALSGNMYSVVNNNALSVSNIKELDIKVYPNPTSNFVNIKFKNVNNRVIKLYSIRGEQVLYKESNAQNETIDIEKLPNGVYFLSINNTMLKVVKK